MYRLSDNIFKYTAAKLSLTKLLPVEKPGNVKKTCVIPDHV